MIEHPVPAMQMDARSPIGASSKTLVLCFSRKADPRVSEYEYGTFARMTQDLVRGRPIEYVS
jgi:hypothetical protein